MTRPNRALEAEVIQRAYGRCEYCHFPVAGAELPFHVDHIIAEKHGGATHSANLAWASFGSPHGTNQKSARVCLPQWCASGRIGGTLPCSLFSCISVVIYVSHGPSLCVLIVPGSRRFSAEIEPTQLSAIARL
jgi:hypothetical protein